MINLYLNSDLKFFYDEDFEQLLDLQHSHPDALDKMAKANLSIINANPKLATLNSCNYDADTCHLSCVKFAYYKDLENKIEKLFEKIANHFKSKGILVQFELIPPQPNPHYNPNSIIDIGYRKKANYFKVHHWKISLKYDNPYVHREFWSLVTNGLARL